MKLRESKRSAGHAELPGQTQQTLCFLLRVLAASSENYQKFELATDPLQVHRHPRTDRKYTLKFQNSTNTLESVKNQAGRKLLRSVTASSYQTSTHCESHHLQLLKDFTVHGFTPELWCSVGKPETLTGGTTSFQVSSRLWKKSSLTLVEQADKSQRLSAVRVSATAKNVRYVVKIPTVNRSDRF